MKKGLKLLNNNKTFLFHKIIIRNKIQTSLIFILTLLIIYSKYLTKKMNIIPIAFSINDNYAYQLIVLLTSILYNSSPNTFFIFYILLAPDLNQTKINKLLGLKEIYKNYKMVLINMKDKYSEYSSGHYKTAAVFYRLYLSNLISDFDKIIYLDIDTIVHKDLNDLYKINMGNYYLMEQEILLVQVFY